MPILTDTITEYTTDAGVTIEGVLIKDGAISGLDSGTGDVVGPGSATDGNLVVFDGTSGKLVKDGGPVPGGAEVAYGTNNIDDAGSGTTYVGRETADGTWLVIKIVEAAGDAVLTYASHVNNSGVSSYSSAWAARASTLTYGAYNAAV